MPSVETPSGLAQAADVLSDQLRVYLKRLAVALRPHAEKIDTQFLKRLKKLNFSPAQSSALAKLTPGAAARILARGHPITEFLEEVQYNGRRLAKLHLSPTGITTALAEYDRILMPLLQKGHPNEYANFQWARQQLQFCVVLTLNNSYYQVREDETQAFYEMFRAELESHGLDELLSRFVLILGEFTRADAVLLLLASRGESSWTRAVSMKAGEAPHVHTTEGFDESLWRGGVLAEPRYLAGRSASGWLMEKSWRGEYASCWSVPLGSEGHIAGVIQFGFRRSYEWLPREQELLTATAERCLRAAEKAWLVQHLAARQEQVRKLAERMLVVEERERRRISRELHDQAGQDLLCMRLKLELLEQSMAPGDERVRAGEIRGLTERTIIEIRRLIAALSPAVLDQLGLAAALRMLVNRMRQMYPCQVKLQIGRFSRLPRNLEMIVYRLVQECTSNIVKHSRANHVNIWVQSADGVLRLFVEDDGVGFPVEEALNRRDTFGLAGIRERVALLGGTLEMQSRPRAVSGTRSRKVGRSGTSVRVELPIRPEGVGSGQEAGSVLSA